MRSFIPKKLLALTVLLECFSRAALLFALTQVPELAQKSFNGKLNETVLFLTAIAAFITLRFFSQKASLGLGGAAKKNLQMYFQHKFLNARPIQNREEKGIPLQELSLRYIKTAELMEPWYSRFLPSAAVAVAVPCLILAVMFFIDKLTFIIILVTGLMLPLFLFLIGKVAKRKSKEQWQSFAKLRVFFLESLQGYKTIKIFKKVKEREQALELAEGEFGKKTFAVLKTAFLSALVQEWAGAISIALVAVSLALRLMNGSAQFSTAFLALLITPEFYRPIRQFGMAFHAAIDAKTAWEGVQRMENNGEDIIENLRIENSFQLMLQTPKERIIIAPERPLYITGAPGCGKTRLVLEMLGYIEPQNKEIKLLYNGDKNNIAWLPQNPVWFKGTLLENLCPASSPANFSDVKAAFESVNLGHFVKRLSEPVLDYANNFSTGEKRRLAIARIILLKRPVWILDEPFASLDEANIRIIERLLEQESKTRAILCISHHNIKSGFLYYFPCL